MSEYAVITQNDESTWDDIKGDLYHYPSTYKAILTPECRVLYYKGKMTNKVYASERLSPDPHYFGVATVGDSIIDSDSNKNDWYCEIVDYQEFEKAVPFKIDGHYFEDIPKSKESNYWRFGVREITKDVFNKILAVAKLSGYMPKLPHPNNDLESYEAVEGGKSRRYTNYYERNPFYRAKAIEIHGLNCMACGINFEDAFGILGKGYIHVHHNKPISETGPTRINPSTDLSVVCPNCHSMIHRQKNRTLSIDELIRILKQGPYKNNMI